MQHALTYQLEQLQTQLAEVHDKFHKSQKTIEHLTKVHKPSMIIY